ncbi:hypothetical protein [Noviherbaspirillum sp.]|uniref:hypothetical protein n=1 Tax=Noviherbaspirillum sp. TaxID=1926288 RepID=UPI002FE16B79
MNLKLLDKSGTTVGEIFVSAENSAVLGDFFPTPAFSIYESLFRDHEQAANDQLFVEVDRLEEEISSLGFYVMDPRNGIQKKITDLQIMEDGISFRWA